MRILYGIMLTAIIIATFTISYKRNKDIFSPLCIVSILQWIRYVPSMVTSAGNKYYKLDEYNTFVVLIIEIIVILCVSFGKILYDNMIARKEVTYKSIRSRKVNLFFLGTMAYSIGFIAYVYFISTSGGVSYIISHPNINYFDGNGYVSSLNIFMIIGIICVIGSEKKRIKKNLMVLIMFSIYAFMFIIFTKRSPVLEVALMLLFYYNYNYKRIRIKRLVMPRTIMLVLIAVIFIVVMPKLRTGEGYSNYNSLSDMISSNLNSIGQVFDEFDYTTRDAFVYSNFNMTNFWGGKNLINLISAPLPRRYFSWKPPIDDGVYLQNLMMGYDIVPPSNDYVFKSSNPFSTQGSMYANFGIFGVIIASILMGMLYGRVYKMLKSTNYDIVMIYVYMLVIYQLELSSLSMMQTLLPFSVTIVFFMIFDGYRLKKVKVNSSKRSDQYVYKNILSNKYNNT